MASRMRFYHCLALVLALHVILPGCAADGNIVAGAAGDRPPNIIVMVADDLGYGDLGFTGSRDIPTPRLDALAQQSVWCRDGYVSAPQCAPMRAGFLTGRYQNRFGFEYNGERHAGYTGLPLDQPTIAERLRNAGYATALIGKWHLGSSDGHRPVDRGFTHHYGFLGGANHYFADSRPKQALQAKIFRNGVEVDEQRYLTDAFAGEAEDFIASHSDKPFFLYMAFNAPHTPNQATDEYLQRVSHISDPQRRTYAAMICGLDDAVGRVLDKVASEGLDRRTLVFFLSDNGGQIKHEFPSNAPFRGGKGDCLEGGIRTPFLVRWTSTLPAGTNYDQPVISLDIHSTALAAAGVDIQPSWELDGVDILPHLTGRRTSPPHDVLFWRFNFPVGAGADRHTWAIRRGDWKLVKDRGEPPRLYNLRDDAGEANDLSAGEPQRVASLVNEWEDWNSRLAKPRWPSSVAAGR
jgi:arylsulfatase A-like enzyme